MAEKQVEIERRPFEHWAKQSGLDVFMSAFVRAYGSIDVGTLLSLDEFKTAVKAALSARFS
jgi:hypothetical protein